MKKAHELYPIAKWLDDCFDNKEFEKINKTLTSLSMNLDKSEYSIIMRITYPWKKHLPGWMDALECLREELYRRKENPDVIFRGLPKQPRALDIYPICKWINDCMIKNELEKINDMLLNVSMNLGCTYLLALLRYTYVLRLELSNWKTALDKIKQELDRRKLDSNNLLKGLL